MNTARKIDHRAGAVFGLLVIGQLLSASALRANTVTLRPVADTTLYEASPNNNLGDGDTFTAGLRPKGGRTRALIEFDLTGLPANIQVTSATLKLTVVNTPPTGPVNSTFALHHATASWGEGNNTSRYGGAPADPGESSWNRRFAGGVSWANPGGDFLGAISSSAFISGNGSYFFASTAGLVSDVQGWHDNPAGNFGWLLSSQAESSSRSIRRFGSRESGANSPSLIVEFTVVPEPSAIALLGVGALAMAGRFLSCRRRRV